MITRALQKQKQHWKPTRSFGKGHDFRRRNYEIQNLKEGTDVYTEMEQLEEEYHEIRKIR